MLIDGRVFFNEQVALRHIGLGLVVVVVAHKVFDRVFREKLAELAVELGRQRLVVRKHNRRAAQARDHIGHGEGLARARNAQQGLEHLAVVDAFNQFVNGLGLVACGWVGLVELEGRVGEGDELASFGRFNDFAKFSGDCIHGSDVG